MRIPILLPESYLGHLQKMDGTRLRSHLLMVSVPTTRLHLSAVDRCLAMLDALQAGYEPKQSSAALRSLVRRMANVAMASLSLATEAYYQCSMSLQRDILETGFLLEFFFRHPAEVEAWMSADRQTLLRNYKPKKIRSRLGEDGADRDRIYETFCEFATHPTTKGARMLLVDRDSAAAGPVLVPRSMQACIGELARNVPYFTVVACKLLVPQMPALEGDHQSLLVFLREWILECYKLQMSTFNDDSMAAWAKKLWPPREA